MTFKVGDKVRRVKNQTTEMLVGFEGVIDSIREHDQWIRFAAPAGGWNPDHFELVKAKELVLEVGGEYKDNSDQLIKIISVYPGKPDIFIGVNTSAKREQIGLYYKFGQHLGIHPDTNTSAYPSLSIQLAPTVRAKDVKVGEVFSFVLNPDIKCIKMNGSSYLRMVGAIYVTTDFTAPNSHDVVIRKDTDNLKPLFL